MNAAPQSAIVRRMPEMLRWGACFALALCFHAVVVAALLEHWTENSDLVANAPVITIDLEHVSTELNRGDSQESVDARV